MATSPLVIRTDTPSDARSQSNQSESIPRTPTRPPTGPLRLSAHVHAVQCERAALHQQRTPAAAPTSAVKRLRFAWADIASCSTIAPCAEYLHHAKSCPSCGAGPRLLTWVTFMSPESTWKALRGTAGILTLCRLCQIQVDYFESFHS